ncbi:MAG TPA: 30S ribosomal protein S24e [Methanocorpusculum sp.]|nr:30S ribosomal protein S24e [Methanocorpusculum sp.]
MDIKITSSTRNDLLSRNELAFTASYNGATPSRMELGAKIAALQNAPVQNIILSPLRSRFGQRSVQGIARIYDSEEAMNAIENKYLIARKQPKVEAKEEVNNDS